MKSADMSCQMDPVVHCKRLVCLSLIASALTASLAMVASVEAKNVAPHPTRYDYEFVAA